MENPIFTYSQKNVKNQITTLCLQYKSEILSQNLNLTYLASMCETLNSHCPTWPIDKSSRWLGYIQGSLMLHRISIPEHSSCFVYSSFLAGLPHSNNTHLFSPPVSRQLIMGKIIKGLCGRYLGMVKPGTEPFKCISELCLTLKITVTFGLLSNRAAGLVISNLY